MKHKVRHYKRNWFTLASIMVLALVLCGTMFYKNSALKQQKIVYAKQIHELKNEQAEQKKRRAGVKQYKKYVKTDQYAERVAREKMSLVYPGEIIFEPDDSH